MIWPDYERETECEQEAREQIEPTLDDDAARYAVAAQAYDGRDDG